MKKLISKSLKKSVSLYRRKEEIILLLENKVIFIARGYSTQDTTSKTNIWGILS